MIFGDIKYTEHIERMYAKPIVKAVNYLKNTDFSALKPGKYEIEGNSIYAQVSEVVTKEKSKAKPEVHRKYIDVQFSIEGKEVIGFARDTGNNRIKEELLEVKDVMFYEGMENEMELIMTPGSFAVFFPEDVHRPGCNYGEEHSIKKVIVKISMDLFKD